MSVLKLCQGSGQSVCSQEIDTPTKYFPSNLTKFIDAKPLYISMDGGIPRIPR